MIEFSCLRSMLFPPKISANQVLDRLRDIDPVKSLILVDRQEVVSTVVRHRPELGSRICRVQSPADFSVFNGVECVYIATEDDDTALPYVQFFVTWGLRFVPVFCATPAGYISTNSLARRVLEAEYQRQERLGFAKWDFGPSDFTNLIQAIETTRGIGGCYLEVGCYRGSSSCAILAYAKESDIRCNFFFLDTFDGFAYEEAAASADALWSNTHQTEGYDVIRDRIMAMRYRSDCVISVERANIIRDPLPAAVLDEGIRVANLDVDMYEAVYAGLCRLAPHVNSGGILICEDSGHTPLLLGARLAVSQFMQSELSLGFIKIEMQSGQTFLIKR